MRQNTLTPKDIKANDSDAGHAPVGRCPFFRHQQLGIVTMKQKMLHDGMNNLAVMLILPEAYVRRDVAAEFFEKWIDRYFAPLRMTD